MYKKNNFKRHIIDQKRDKADTQDVINSKMIAKQLAGNNFSKNLDYIINKDEYLKDKFRKEGYVQKILEKHQLIDKKKGIAALPAIKSVLPYPQPFGERSHSMPKMLSI